LIVVIIVIAIAIPLISNIKEIVRREAFRATAHSIADAGRLLIANENESQGYQEFYYLDGKEYNADNRKLEYSGKGPKTGVVILNENSKVVLAIHNGTYCATRSADTNRVTVTKTKPEDCKAYSIIYTCDIWEEIALKYGVSLEELLELNNENDPNSSTCDRGIKVPVSLTLSGGTYAGSDGQTIYYKTYYTVGYVSSSSILPLSYDYTIKLGVLPLDVEDIKITRVTMESVFESLDDFKRYITKRNMGEVIWQDGDQTPIDISQASVFRDHAARNLNMTTDDVVVECDEEACYATVSATMDNLTNVNSNMIEGVGQVAYAPIKFTVEFNGEGETCAVRTTADLTPGILAGTGTSADPYLVESVEDLVALSKSVNAGNSYSTKYISLINSFSFSNVKSYMNPSTTEYGDINGNGVEEGLLIELTTGAGFLPIGNNSARFKGRLLGNTECIFDLYINRPTTSFVGFIGSTSGGNISALSLKDANIIGADYSGGIAGYSAGSINSGSVSGNVKGNSRVGLITGHNDGSISSAIAEGNVEGASNVGGLVGVNAYHKFLKGVYTGGSVKGTGSNVNRCVGSLDGSGNLGVAALSSITINDAETPSNVPYNNKGIDISSMSDLDNINLAEWVYDTYIGGDNDGDGYYWDYDTSYRMVRKPVTDDSFAVSFGGGTGEAATPYEISTNAQLRMASVNPGKSYKLMNDLDLQNEHFYMLSSRFNKFTGNFDGNGKAIKNLTINNPKDSYVGFFGHVNSSSTIIKDLKLEEPKIIGYNYIGSLVGYKENGKINNVNILNAHVSGVDYIGGITGYNNNNINSSTVSGDITGNYRVGLIAGYNTGGISSVIADGNVTGGNEVGGLVGTNAYHKLLKAVYKSGSVVGTGTRVNRCVGYIDGSSNIGMAAMDTITVNAAQTPSNVVYDNKGVDINSMSDLDNINLAEFVYDTYIGGDNDGDGYYWDYDESYKIVRKPVTTDSFAVSFGGGTGEAATPYEISTNAQLRMASVNPGKSYKLMKDLDLQNEHFYMLSSRLNKFTGNFDGNGKAIKYLTINNPKGSFVGFFGVVNSSSTNIKDLTLEAPNVIGYHYTGSLVGHKENGKINNVNVLTADVSGADYVGAITGYNNNNINSSTVSGNVKGNSRVGLITGHNDGGISSAIADGNVEGVSNVGGLVGVNAYKKLLKGIFRSGSVVGTGSNVNRCVGSIDNSTNVGMAAMNTITVNAAETPSNVVYGNNGVDISSMSDLDNINLAELVYDTYIGGDGDGDGYYWDYDESYKIVRKSVTTDSFAVSFGGGTGEVATPYEIFTNAQLRMASVNPSKSYKLMNNLDLQNEYFYMLSSKFNKFTGNFDGNGKIIKNLTINIPKGSYIGFFGIVNSSSTIIKDLKLEAPNIIGHHYTGALVGYKENGIIKGVNLSTVNVTGADYVGGITSYNNNNIDNSTVSGEVKGNYRGGLIAGYNTGGISSVVADGNVTGGSEVGGLVGYNAYKKTLKGIFRSGSVVGTGSRVNRCVGYIDNSTNVGVAAMSTIPVNGEERTGTVVASVNGLDASSSDLETSTIYTNIGFNFTPAATEYTWYFDNGIAKFLKN